MKKPKQPLYALLIAPDHETRRSILYGGKCISIREGNRDYRPGPVMICCHLEPWAVMADITSVRHCALAEVTEEEYEADGFWSHDELLAGLRQYYPNINLDSPVTVIRWNNVRGWLVDNKIEYRLRPQTLYGKIQPNVRK